MGQKTNPNILRLGKLKEWSSKYIEKKPTESSITIFRDLEIKKFLSQLFSQNGLELERSKTYFSENSLHIYISYYNKIKPVLSTTNSKLQFTQLKSKLFEKKIAIIKKKSLKKKLYLVKVYNKHLQKTPFQQSYLLNKKTQRLNTLKIFQDYINRKTYPTVNKHNRNLFITKILKGLSLFTNKKHNIFLSLKQVNKESVIMQKVLKKNKHKVKENFAKLRKFQQNEFFKKGFNLLYNFIINQQDSIFLAKFIALFLKKQKRPNFFLRFLESTLKLLIIQKFSRFERVQIKIKGRFNGAPRSTHKFLNIGKNIPVLSLNSNINYSETTAYTANGTFGIKVWTYTTII